MIAQLMKCSRGNPESQDQYIFFDHRDTLNFSLVLFFLYERLFVIKVQCLLKET